MNLSHSDGLAADRDPASSEYPEPTPMGLATPWLRLEITMSWEFTPPARVWRMATAPGVTSAGAMAEVERRIAASTVDRIIEFLLVAGR
jgi:hypothetical protein